MNADTWTKRHCWTDDDVTWRAQSHQHCGVKLATGTWHRSTPLGRDETPTIALDFAVRKAPADGGADNDLGTSLAIVDSSTGCMRAAASEGAADFLASSVADFVKNLFVGKFRLRSDNEPLDHGGGRETENSKMPDRVVAETSPRHSSASNGLAEPAIRTMGEQLRSLRYDTQNRYKT